MLPEQSTVGLGVVHVRNKMSVGLRRQQCGGQEGKTINTISPVTRMFQVKIGIRNMVMPGARSVSIVAMTMTAPRIVPRPDMTSPMIHMSEAMPGEVTWFASG